MARTLALLLVLVGLASAQNPQCPFGPGTCPTDLDNVIEIYSHDPADYYSCQTECEGINECHFFTMFVSAESGDNAKKMKCFLWKNCDVLEPCPECITGMERS